MSDGSADIVSRCDVRSTEVFTLPSVVRRLYVMLRFIHRPADHVVIQGDEFSERGLARTPLVGANGRN